MERLFRNNMALLIVSFMLSVALWSFVSGGEVLRGSEITRLFEPQINFINIGSGLKVTGGPPQATVIVSGLQQPLLELTNTNVYLYADLNGRPVGDQEVPLKVRLPKNLRLLNLLPETVNLKLERVAVKELTVQVQIEGTPAGGRRKEIPRVIPETVSVQGTEEELKSVGQVVATVEVNGASSDVVKIVPVQVLDPAGLQLTGLTIHPPVVEVTAPISLPAATVPVIARLRGTPAAGYVVKQVLVDPEQAEVTGAESILGAIKYLETAPVEIAGAVEPIQRTVMLVQPEGTVVRPLVVRVTVGIVREAGEAGEAAEPGGAAGPGKADEPGKTEDSGKTVDPG